MSRPVKGSRREETLNRLQQRATETFLVDLKSNEAEIFFPLSLWQMHTYILFPFLWESKPLKVIFAVRY